MYTKEELVESYEDSKERFDFSHVKKIMKKLRWRWGRGTKLYYPSEKDMVRLCDQLFESVLKSERKMSGYSTSGGFRVHRSEWGKVEILFVIEWA